MKVDVQVLTNQADAIGRRPPARATEADVAGDEARQIE